jgi:hypothetical protein
MEEVNEIPEEIEFSQSFKNNRLLPIDTDIPEEIPITESQELGVRNRQFVPEMSKVVDETEHETSNTNIDSNQFPFLYKIVNGK